MSWVAHVKTYLFVCRCNTCTSFVHMECIMRCHACHVLAPSPTTMLLCCAGVYTNTYDATLNVKNGFPVFSTLVEANHIQVCVSA